MRYDGVALALLAVIVVLLILLLFGVGMDAR